MKGFRLRICELCGLEAEGFAEIDGKPFCHGERRVTCYEVSGSSTEPADSRISSVVAMIREDRQHEALRLRNSGE